MLIYSPDTFLKKIILPILPPSILNENVATVIRWKFDKIVAVASNATGTVVFFFSYCRLE